MKTGKNYTKNIIEPECGESVGKLCSELFEEKYSIKSVEDFNISFAKSDCAKFKSYFGHWNIDDNCNIEKKFLKKKATGFYSKILQQLKETEKKSNDQGVNFVIPNLDVYFKSKILKLLKKESKYKKTPECGTTTNILCPDLFERKYGNLDKLKAFIYTLIKDRYREFHEVFDTIPRDNYGSFDENGFNKFIQGIFTHVKGSLITTERNSIKRTGKHEVYYLDGYVRKIIIWHFFKKCSDEQQRKKRLLNSDDLEYFRKWLNLPKLSIDDLKKLSQKPLSIENENLISSIKKLPGYRNASFSIRKKRLYIHLNFEDRVDMLNYLTTPMWDDGVKWNRGTRSPGYFRDVDFDDENGKVREVGTINRNDFMEK